MNVYNSTPEVSDVTLLMKPLMYCRLNLSLHPWKSSTRSDRVLPFLKIKQYRTNIFYYIHNNIAFLKIVHKCIRDDE